MTNKLTDDLYAALKAVEFAGNDNDGKGPYCPCCHSREAISHQHKPECRVGKALAQYDLVKKAQELTAPA